MELSREWYSDSPVNLSGLEKENTHKFFASPKPMVVTPSKSPLLEAWNSAGKKNKLRQPPQRIITKEKSSTVMNDSSPRMNKSPLHVPVSMETSSLGKKTFLNMGTPTKANKPTTPRFATPTRASRMAAEAVAKSLKEATEKKSTIHMVSPSPTKSSNKSQTSPRKTSSNKASPKVELNGKISDPNAPPKQSRVSGRSPATTSPPKSFMKSTVSSRASRKVGSSHHSNSYAELASTSCAEEAALYARVSPAKMMKSPTPAVSSSQSVPSGHNKTTPVSAALQATTGPALVTPSPELPRQSHEDAAAHGHTTIASIGEKLSFDMEDLLTTMNMATKSLNKSKKIAGTVKHSTTPTSSCAATLGEGDSGSGEDRPGSSDEMSQVKVNKAQPKIMEVKQNMVRQASPLRKSHTVSTLKQSPARKPWRPSSTTPKRVDIFNSSPSTTLAVPLVGTVTPNKKKTVCDNTHLFDSSDGSLSPISRKTEQLLNGNNRTPIRSPAPFAAKRAPYTASPPKRSGNNHMRFHDQGVAASDDADDVQEQELPPPPVSSKSQQPPLQHSSVSEGDDLNSDVKEMSDFSALPPRPNHDPSSDTFNFDNDDKSTNPANMRLASPSLSYHGMDAEDENTSSSSIGVLKSFQGSPVKRNSSRSNGSNANNLSSSFSLGDYPSPMKTAHGFPIQAQPRFHIMNPVSFALNDDALNVLDEESMEDRTGVSSPFMTTLDNAVNETKDTNVNKTAGLMGLSSFSGEQNKQSRSDGDGGAFQPLINDREGDKTPSPPLLSTDFLPYPPTLSSSTSEPITSLANSNMMPLKSKMQRSVSTNSYGAGAAPFRYISADPLVTKNLETLVRPIASPSPQASPRDL